MNNKNFTDYLFDKMEQDNTLPISSAGVFQIVGNIQALLETI